MPQAKSSQVSTPMSMRYWQTSFVRQAGPVWGACFCISMALRGGSLVTKLKAQSLPAIGRMSSQMLKTYQGCAEW